MLVRNGQGPPVFVCSLTYATPMHSVAAVQRHHQFGFLPAHLVRSYSFPNP